MPIVLRTYAIRQKQGEESRRFPRLFFVTLGRRDGGRQFDRELAALSFLCFNDSAAMRHKGVRSWEGILNAQAFGARIACILPKSTRLQSGQRFIARHNAHPPWRPEMRVDPSDPYPSYPGAREDAVKWAQDKILSTVAIPEILRAGLAEHAASLVESERQPLPRNAAAYGGALGSTNWVLRNEHLDLLTVLGPTALSIASAATAASGGSPVVPAITALLAIVAVARKVNSKVVRLRKEDFPVLMALRQLGPSTAADVARALRQAPPKGIDPSNWTEATVMQTLGHLKSVPAQDGSLETLVNGLANGLWTANGV